MFPVAKQSRVRLASEDETLICENQSVDGRLEEDGCFERRTEEAGEKVFV